MATLLKTKRNNFKLFKSIYKVINLLFLQFDLFKNLLGVFPRVHKYVRIYYLQINFQQIWIFSKAVMYIYNFGCVFGCSLMVIDVFIRFLLPNIFLHRFHVRNILLLCISDLFTIRVINNLASNAQKSTNGIVQTLWFSN